jgi:hypothetical protein
MTTAAVVMVSTLAVGSLVFCAFDVIWRRPAQRRAKRWGSEFAGRRSPAMSSDAPAGRHPGVQQRHVDGQRAKLTVIAGGADNASA